MGVDYGDKRVGIAISDPLGMTAQAKPYIYNTKSLIPNILTLIDEQNIQAIVVGLPQNRHGQDTAQTEKVRAFVDALKEQTLVDVSYWNEAYSSKAVTRTLIEGDVSRKKRKELIDSQSAAFFLQGFLDKA